MEQGFTLTELLVIIIILGILLLISVTSFAPLFEKEPSTTYCNILRGIRSYLEIVKEQDLIERCYPSSITIEDIKQTVDIPDVDPYSGNHLLLYNVSISASQHCPSVTDTNEIVYCPIVVDGCGYSYKINISDKIKNDTYRGCLLGVDYDE